MTKATAKCYCTKISRLTDKTYEGQLKDHESEFKIVAYDLAMAYNQQGIDPSLEFLNRDFNFRSLLDNLPDHQLLHINFCKIKAVKKHWKT